MRSTTRGGRSVRQDCEWTFGDEPDYSSGIPWTRSCWRSSRRRRATTWRRIFLRGSITCRSRGRTWRGQTTTTCGRHLQRLLLWRAGELGEGAQRGVPGASEPRRDDAIAGGAAEGDFFRDERYVETPGIDNLNQLIPSAVHTPDGTWNINNNFPSWRVRRRISSASRRLGGRGRRNGHRRQVQMDFQLVRGVTTLALRVPWTHAHRRRASAAKPRGAAQAKITAMYGNRGGYLMSIGRPAAQVGYTIRQHNMDGRRCAQEADRSTTKLAGSCSSTKWIGLLRRAVV